MQIPMRPANAHNYSSRRGCKIDTIIVHTTQSNAASAVHWFADPDAMASAHYVVGADGTITQCVPEEYAAWHAGNGAINRRSIGIECEGDCDRAETWTPALTASLCWLMRDLATRYNIIVDRDHVMGHEDVPDPRDITKKGGAHHHRDPGKWFPWTLVMTAMQNAVKGVEING